MPQTEWVDILRRVGWPTDVLVIDFETYFDSEYQLKKMSTIEFIADDRFEMLGVATLHISGKKPFAPIEPTFHHDAGQNIRFWQSRFGDNLERCTVVMQNARFDASILAYHYGIHPPYIVDVLNLSRHLHARHKSSLAVICERYGLPSKGDTEQFRGYRWTSRFGPPVLATVPGEINTLFGRKKKVKQEVVWINPDVYQVVQNNGMDTNMRSALAQYAANDAAVEFMAFRLLLPKLARPTVELKVMQHTLQMFTNPCLMVDAKWGEQLVQAMKAKVEEAARAVGVSSKNISGNKSFVKLLEEALGDESIPMKEGKAGQIPAIAKGDEGRVWLENHDNPRVRALMAGRSAAKSWPLHAARVRRILDQSAPLDGRLPIPLAYHGAHTGRWTGGEKINPQNFGKRSAEPMVTQVRQLIMAPDGHRLICTDASQIEARGLAWIAGQWDLVKMFDEGEAIYCKFATDIVGQEIRKPLPDDPDEIAKYFKSKRQLGKVGVLGCGYGMGADKCQTMAKQQYKIDISITMAQRIVDHYRGTNSAIVRFWRDIEAAFKFVTKYHHETRELPRGLKFHREEDCTIITLPCGRRLYYRGAAVASDGRDEYLWWPDPRIKGTRIRMWGGYLTENVVQALSRDILAEAILASENMGKKIGLRIGHHVHDELIGVVPEEHAESALAVQLTALRTRPDWAPELPLDAEGTITRRYGE